MTDPTEVDREDWLHMYEQMAKIRAFEERTGVPMVLNTSFNENEPIVNTPGEALDCFLRTRMDRLVLGDRVVTRDGRGGAEG